MRPASCMPDACFCEAIRSGNVMQPANAWSSLAFVVVAVVVIARWSRDSSQSGRFNGRSAYPLLYAFALMAVGLGSAFFHATLSFPGQFADVMGMYFVATFALIYGLDRLRTLSAGQIIGGYVATNVALAMILYWFPVARRLVFGALIVAVLMVEALIKRTGGPPRGGSDLRNAVGALAVAFLIWILDYTRLLCSPGSLLQGHAAWHVLGAIAAWYLYRFYRNQSGARHLMDASTH